jgi:hypothetical protein
MKIEIERRRKLRTCANAGASASKPLIQGRLGFKKGSDSRKARIQRRFGFKEILDSKNRVQVDKIKFKNMPERAQNKTSAPAQPVRETFHMHALPSSEWKGQQ